MNAVDRDGSGTGAMKIVACVFVASLTAVGCADGPAGDQDVATKVAALNGTLVGTNGPLTRMTFPEPSEAARRADTVAYYATVRTGVHGNDGGTIATDLDTLDKFKARYELNDGPAVTYYYNRGDLGIGREMHCVDHVNYADKGEIACYVTNFAAGDDNSEFSFGLSANIAFANMHANHGFATVAMVFRNLAPNGSANKLFFVVYDDAGNLLNFAALDRHAVSFATAFNATKPNNPDPAFGTPGVNFNLHIPTNCASCHGGTYDKTTHVLTGGLFLPFDLDQFEYENVPGRTRADQLDEFRRQNQMAWKVAAVSPGIGESVKAQIQTWYHRTPTGNPLFEILAPGQFDSNAVPAGWVGFESAYKSFVRGSCRGCHVTVRDSGGLRFDTEAQFRHRMVDLVQYLQTLCYIQMPHSLQNLREFWQSSAPIAVEDYFRSIGKPGIADVFHGCAPGSIVTLDPPQLTAALAPLGM
jgi:hypothetical protein